VARMRPLVICLLALSTLAPLRAAADGTVIDTVYGTNICPAGFSPLYAGCPCRPFVAVFRRWGLTPIGAQCRPRQAAQGVHSYSGLRDRRWGHPSTPINIQTGSFLHRSPPLLYMTIALCST
jgi:hypothetical protein